LCKLTGDKLIKKEYTRLGQLIVEDLPITSIKDIKPGDCLIAFSKRKLFSFRSLINKQLSKGDINSCAIIYGNLPPSTKKSQVNLFNLIDNQIDYLCATDSVIYKFIIRLVLE
jgi:ATP-dependent RNA helicase SUPV3L1/SUV3